MLHFGHLQKPVNCFFILMKFFLIVTFSEYWDLLNSFQLLQILEGTYCMQFTFTHYIILVKWKSRQMTAKVINRKGALIS
jgi:hypothetical protein